MTAKERLCSFILEHLDDNTMLIDLPMLRNDIADYLGLTMETISRTMTRLRDDGIIRTPTQNSIEVSELARLMKVSGAVKADGPPFSSQGI
jgi:CRP/FNR family transcriptional regulator